MRFKHSAPFLSLVAFISFLPVVLPAPANAQIGVGISVGIAPPALPVYEQPPCPTPGLMWTPGYWGWGDAGYYWVPGAWVEAPFVGALWTPGYWGWGGGRFFWHGGYWGLHVGYYGGINYGFGYGGIGFFGGEWRGGAFAYNTAVVNVNRTTINNVYVNKTVINNNTIINNNHVAYNGGPGGINHEPTPQERSFSNEQHTPPTSFQTQHESAFQHNPEALAKNNGGHPQMAALSTPITHNTTNFGAAANRNSIQPTNNNTAGNRWGGSSPQLNNPRPSAQDTASRPGQFNSNSQYHPNEQSQYRPNHQQQNRPQSQYHPKQRHSNPSNAHFRR